MTNLDGSVAIVTGAARWHGWFHSLVLADAGVSDVQDEATVAACVLQAPNTFEHIDLLLIINVPITGMMPFWQIHERQWDAFRSITFKAVWHIAKHIAPQMRKQRAGRIINIASGARVRGKIYLAHIPPVPAVDHAHYLCPRYRLRRCHAADRARAPCPPLQQCHRRNVEVQRQIEDVSGARSDLE